jgi:hypothetical protein
MLRVLLRPVKRAFGYKGRRKKEQGTRNKEERRTKNDERKTGLKVESSRLNAIFEL